MNKLTLISMVIGITLLAMGSAKGALILTEDFKLFASDGSAGDSFSQVSIDGDTAVVGASSGAGNSPFTGAAYVFERDDGFWTEEAKLTASDGAAGDAFGRFVSIDGDTVVIGAFFDDDKGSAYVFVRDEDGIWTEEAKLTAFDGAAGDLFGVSVSIDEDTALIGASLDDDLFPASGAAYVFVRDDDDSSDDGIWTLQQKLTASNPTFFAQLGFSVSLDGDMALIGAALGAGNSPLTGAAYVFVRDDGIWTEEAKLAASDAAIVSLFGVSVSLDEDTALIGAPFDNVNGPISGSAYVFVRDDGMWTQQGPKLTPLDGATGDFFGSVSLDEDTALIGAAQAFTVKNGAAYVFVRDDGIWTEEAKLLASDGAASDGFGGTVSLDEDTALIGAFNGDGKVADSGAAYIFEDPEDDDSDS